MSDSSELLQPKTRQSRQKSRRKSNNQSEEAPSSPSAQKSPSPISPRKSRNQSPSYPSNQETRDQGSPGGSPLRRGSPSPGSPKGRIFSSRGLFRPLSRPPLLRAQSSPSQLVISDADLLQKVRDTLIANSTPIKLEDRRKCAPLTPAGHDRKPKLLGMERFRQKKLGMIF